MIDWTTLVECVRTRWPWSAPVALRATSILAIEQTIPLVPGEYHALYAYLEHRYASVVVLTFDQMRRSSDAHCRRPHELRANGGRTLQRRTSLHSVDRSRANRRLAFTQLVERRSRARGLMVDGSLCRLSVAGNPRGIAADRKEA